MKLSSKSILDRVSKIEKKYIKSKQIRNDYDDEDISIEETDFRVGGKAGYIKSKMLSQLHSKGIPQNASDHYLIDTNSLQNESREIHSEADDFDGTVSTVVNKKEERTEFLSEYGKEHSVSLNQKLKKENIINYSSSFSSTPLYLKESCSTSKFRDKQNSMFVKNIKMPEHDFEDTHLEISEEFLKENMEIERESHISDDCLHMNLNLKLDEDIDENCSSSVQNESCIFDAFNIIGQNVKPLKYLFDEDDKSISDIKGSLNGDNPSECKDIATEADSLSDKALSESFAEEVMSSANNSFSARTAGMPPLDDINMNDFQISSFCNLNLNLPSLEDLMVEQESESKVKKEYSNDIEKYQENIFQSRSDSSIELEKIVSANQKDEAAPPLSRTSSVSSPVNSVVETECVSSTINEDIKEDIDLYKTDKISPQYSHLQNITRENISPTDVDNSRNFPRTCDSKNNSQIKSKSQEEKYISNYKNSENLSLIENVYIGKIRDIEDLQDLLDQDDTNVEVEECSSDESTTINEDIEEDINCSIEDNIDIDKFSGKYDDMQSLTSPTISDIPSLSIKQNNFKTMIKKVEISKSKNSKLDNLTTKYEKKTGTDLKNETHEMKGTQKEKLRKQNDNTKNKRKINNESATTTSKSSIINNKIIDKCTRNVSSQTNPNVMFLTDKDKEFDKKIEEIFTSSFTSIPSLTPYNMSQIPTGEEATKDLLGPFERGFHWALKQQVELTKHFIQSEYNMYATCMTAIKELSAQYKPVSIHKYKKGKK